METKAQILNKLKELKIVTDNAYPKKIFVNSYVPVVSLFDNEFKEDFYFSADYGKKLYKFPKTENFKDLFPTDNHLGNTKYLVPVAECELIWEDKPFQELEDEPYAGMTIRRYAAIHLKVPNSGLAWLDQMIKDSPSVILSHGG